ncbi:MULTISPECIES: F0F1 ATP synthase subunit epsilon [Francisella]|uniref:ATP synthase epsilon chain n=1 Tax=Francisella adeliensis TaxID=2007306 RepID=A0A2Z4XXA2_9GAMM|nr:MULTISPECIES: F0F1 ATP synthase subunit epsilon [Francisella]AXA33092.1 ATP synthase F1 subunit epsilon [Francisella adeliensis]MBK2086016.1 F0F1 ATP synthase subunit epsilon [Francisella adeliensis]MBK2096820.1 F0F1 ATP synthase subunit epsilon [Francisella adeliensis]QIW11322.1 F0F1 ATP synthase subunit epsilon [Francisella adeliensis]QIW13196.1 F0F1 ATP synthase subunit epsilon [Francisella adeliensis]
MSKNYLKVDVVSPLGSVFTGEADMVSLRGSAGEMGIAYGHTELLSTMPAGVVNIRKDESTEVLYVSGGIIEVTPKRVTIMVDDMEKAENLNQAEAEKAKIRAQEALAKKDASQLDIDAAHTRLKEADARLKALNSSKGIYYSKD